MSHNRRNLSKDRVDIESLERENDSGLSLLSERVGLLKSATMGIKSEVDSQHKVLDDIDGGMTGTRGLLGSITDRFNVVMADKTNNKIIFGVSAVCVLLLFMWFLSKK